ncbi:MAG: hypothetical protein K1X72_25790 [Pyrinomonadaceae bacterium]|nr:hypothetical protein [Pyrinomonadaceae bacterium]
MKKLAFLSIIVSLFFTVNATAQFKPPANKKELTNQQKMLPFAMGMALSVLGERYDENHYEVIVSLQKQIRYWSAELKPVVDLKNEKNNYLRREVIEKATKALQEKSSQPDRWQILLGDYFGNIFVELKKAEDEKVKPDSAQIKFYIEVIEKMAQNPPQDIPWDVLDKLNKFSELSKIEDFSTDENIKLLAGKVINILDEITKE